MEPRVKISSTSSTSVASASHRFESLGTSRRSKRLILHTVALAAAVVAAFGTAHPASANEWGCMVAKRTGKAVLIQKHCDKESMPPDYQVASIADDLGSPKGSFVETCQNTQQQGWLVFASCKTRLGEWSQTSTNFKGCAQHSLSNVNGNLVCGP